MKTKLFFLTSALVLISSSALAAGGKSFDAYVGDHTLAEKTPAAKDCPHTMSLAYWESKNGVAMEAGSLKGNFPRSSFDKDGYIACYAGKGNEKTCTQVKTERKDGQLWISEARYLVKGKTVTALQKLSPVVSLRKTEKEQVEYKRFFQGKESYSCTYRPMTETEIQAKKAGTAATVVAKATTKKRKSTGNRMPASTMKPILAPMLPVVPMPMATTTPQQKDSGAVPIIVLPAPAN